MATYSISPEFDQLLNELSKSVSEQGQVEVVQLVKRTFGGKFQSLDDDDLYSCLKRLVEHSYFSETKPRLIEEFLAPKSNDSDKLKERIREFNPSDQAIFETENVLQGRDDEIEDIVANLEAGDSPAVNLYGSAGVGKTTLANAVCSKWQESTKGELHSFDLRETETTNDLYRCISGKLKLTELINEIVQKNRDNEPLSSESNASEGWFSGGKETPKEPSEERRKFSKSNYKKRDSNKVDKRLCTGDIDLNKLLQQIYCKIQKLNSKRKAVLFLLDNAESFFGGEEKQSEAFLQFLKGFVDFDGKGKSVVFKILLTSRIQLRVNEMVDNIEVKPLTTASSDKVLSSNGVTYLSNDAKEKIIHVCQGNPLLLNVVSGILRQQREGVEDLIGGLAKMSSAPEKGTLDSSVKEQPFNFEGEGVGIEKMCILMKMFDSLPSYNLKSSAVVVSLFCGPFSHDDASSVLDVDLSEAVVLLEGLRASEIISLQPDTKELMYDIHPFLKKYVSSLKHDPKYQRSYEKAEGKFFELFLSKAKDVAMLINVNPVAAFEQFEINRQNYELALDISLSQPSVAPLTFWTLEMIVFLFNATLSSEERIATLLSIWADKCEDDGESESLFQADLRCWEALKVLNVDGTKKAFEVLKKAFSSLQKVLDKSSEFFKLSWGLYLYAEGEIHWRNRNYRKSLESLVSSIDLTEELLKSHSHLVRSYNAIGNCCFSLNKPEEALTFYNKAYMMQMELSGLYHIDMPIYKNQIGTVYDSQGEYDRAAECYKQALELLEELKLSGSLDEALICRNLANALMFQKKFPEAVEPAERAYNIRIKILGDHPLTVRSIFQRAVIQANFEEYGKALQLFLEAWEMEKTLAVGNHSEVWRKIITGVEDMCDRLNEEKKNFKEQFRTDALKFCQSFWEEEKSSEQFSCTVYNKDIVDALTDLAEDQEDKYQVQKDALLFYMRMYNDTEEEFQKEFAQETENHVLNEMLKERDEILDKLIDLCLQLDEHNRLAEHKMNKVALYQKVLLRPGFVGEKKRAFDKASLKSRVERLYQDVDQREEVQKFRENLLHFWQKEWDKENIGEKMKVKEVSVGWERTIRGILQLCQELKQEELCRRYGKEALNFYEEIWKAKQSTMKPPEMKKFLRNIRQLASSTGDRVREKHYHKAYIALQDGREPEVTLCSRALEEEKLLQAVEFASKSDDQDGDEEKEVEVDADDEKDTTLHNEDGKKTVIRRGKITDEGDTWILKEAAASITFHHGAITKSVLITCSLWNPGALAPTIGSNEVLVSNVIELSRDGPPDLEFMEDASMKITVALLHSASNFKGYEIVIKQLVDPENNEWKDLETRNVWHTSVNPGIPDWMFPFAEATCTKTCFSSFAAIWRLKSFVFPKPKSVTPEFICTVPDYPNVSVAIPWNSVPASQDFCLTLKVQEPPSIDQKREEMLVGPILHISCSHDVELLEPAKISVPLALFEGKRELADMHSGQWRILHCQSRQKSQEWTDITDQLEMSVALTDEIVTFQVKTFCQFWPWKLNNPAGVDAKDASDLYNRIMKQPAGFLACLCSDAVPERFLLKLFCFPLHLRSKVNHDISKYVVIYQGDGNSRKPLSNDDETFVALSEGLKVHGEENTEDISLRFLGYVEDHENLRVTIEDRSNLKVDFLKWLNDKERTDSERICRVFFIPVQVPVQVTSLPSFPFTPQETLPKKPNTIVRPQVDAATTSQVVPGQKHPLWKRLKVTLLGEEWTSLAGGLSTFNRELAIHLAKHPAVEVTLLVPKDACTHEHKKEALRNKVTVIEAGKCPGYEPREWLISPPEDFNTDVVIGHGQKLGRQGQMFRRSPYNCKWIQVVHTAPEELGMFKNYSGAISRAERKHETEVELCKMADLVVPVGPKLKYAYSSYLRSQTQNIFALTPGLFKEFADFSDLNHEPNKGSEFKVLLCGRGDPEDFELKGYDIAAKAFTGEELRASRCRLVFVGAPDGKQDDIAEKLLKFGIAKKQLVVRKFVGSRDKMRDLLCEVDQAIMPSRTEGFGLIALEALSAGLPILVGSNSGFAQAIKDLPFGKLCIVDSEDPNEWAKAINSVQVRHEEHLKEIKKLRESYGKKYNWEEQCEVLVDKMRNMIHGVN